MLLKKINLSEENIMKIGRIGVYLYGFSILVKKNILNIGLALMVIAGILLVKNFSLKKLDKVQNLFLILILLTPLFDFFSPGGIESAGISIQKSYRFLPLFLAPIFLKNIEHIKKFIFFINMSVLFHCFFVLNMYRELNWNFNIRYEGLPGVQYSSHHLVGLSYIVLGLMLLAYKEKNKILLFLSSFTYIFSLFIIFVSKTRGAWLALSFSMLFFLILLLNKKIILVLSICCILGSGFLIMNREKYENNVYYKRLVSIKDTKAASPRIRLMLWETAFNIWKEHPIFGVGKDNSPKFYVEYFEKNKEYVEKNLPDRGSQAHLMEIAKSGNTHSMYFDNLLNMGLLSFYWAGIMIYTFILQLKSSIKLKISQNNYRNFIITLSSLCSLVVYSISGALGSAWGSFLARHIFLIGLVLYISINKLGDKEND